MAGKPYVWSPEKLAIIWDELPLCKDQEQALEMVSNVISKRVEWHALEDALKRGRFPGTAYQRLKQTSRDTIKMAPAEPIPLEDPALDETDEEDEFSGKPDPKDRHIEDYEPLTIDATESGEFCFAVTSDIHFASKYHYRDAYQDFVHTAYKKHGVRLILNPGDTLNGMYKHSRWEETAHGVAAQAQVACNETPRLPGLEYYAITGNHDETFEDSAGFEVGSYIEDVFRRNGRTDYHYIGQRGGYLRLSSGNHPRGAYVHLWHPRGNQAYAVTYKLQKKIEGYLPGQKPDFLFCGHFHQSTYIPIRGVHAFMAGTFQGPGGAFSNSLTSAPAIGGWIVKYTLTNGGAIREVQTHWRGYSLKETVREVELG